MVAAFPYVFFSLAELMEITRSYWLFRINVLQLIKRDFLARLFLARDDETVFIVCGYLARSRQKNPGVPNVSGRLPINQKTVIFLQNF